MTTPRTRSLVSLVAALTFTSGLGGCAAGPVRLASDAPTPMEGPPPTVQFDNASLDYVNVYLIGIRREWVLGRVAPGGRAALRIPADALGEDEGQLRLAVLPGDRAKQPLGAERRLVTALAWPAEEIVSQRWTFTQRPTYAELVPLPLPIARGDVRHP